MNVKDSALISSASGGEEEPVCKPVDAFEQLVSELTAGHPAIFPTDTVYGLGVAVEHCPDPGIVFKLKSRDPGKPLAWLVASQDDLVRYGAQVSQEARELAAAHWPGALTIIVKAGSLVPDAYRSEKGSIALRMPDSEVALELIRAVGCPLATTSANLSGRPAARRADEVDEQLKAQLSCLLDDSQVKSGKASTLVDCSGPVASVLRQGEVLMARRG